MANSTLMSLLQPDSGFQRQFDPGLCSCRVGVFQKERLGRPTNRGAFNSCNCRSSFLLLTGEPPATKLEYPRVLKDCFRAAADARDILNSDPADSAVFSGRSQEGLLATSCQQRSLWKTTA
jgi:hypothetical protein